MLLNWIGRWIFPGLLIRLLFPVHVDGIEKLPKHGPAIFVLGPHKSEFESLVVASHLPRHWLRFFAKQEYWEKHPFIGKLMTGIGLLPIPRQASRALLAQIDLGVAVLEDEGVLGIYPEATRGLRDNKMHRGYPGFAYMSLRAGGVPIYPIGLIGMRRLERADRKGLARLRPGRATMVVGDPIYPMAFRMPEHAALAERALERVLVKPLVTKVSKELARLSTAMYDDKPLPIPDN